MIDPCTPPVELLNRLGPGVAHPAPVGRDEAWAYVRGLANSHYENFSVLSSLVPLRLRDDFAAIYAFCRWSDDLGDETGSDEAARQRSTELLGWWRAELDACFAGKVQHPVYVALADTINRHKLPRQPFTDLIDAFAQDQRVTQYQTWDQLLDYCARSANPVGRLVLMLAGYHQDGDPANTERFRMSDAMCTALQLINFWQDVRRDLLERDRVYVPSLDTGVTPEMLRDWLQRGDDAEVRIAYIRAMRPLVEKTRLLFAQGAGLPAMLDAEIRPVVWLFGAGGQSVLEAVERIGCATLWQRPKLSKFTKGSLVLRAWLSAKLAGRTRVQPISTQGAAA